MYVYQPIQKKTMFTRPDLSRAEALADEDNPSIRDVRPLMSILMRMRRADPRLRGHILTRSTAVSAFDWTIKPVSANVTPQDIEFAERARVRCTKLIRETIAHRLQATLYDAVAIQTEILRTPDAGAIQRPIKRYRPVELEKTSDYEVSIFEPGDAKKIAVQLPIVADTVNDKFGTYIIAVSDDDERGGLLRSIAIHEQLLWEMTNEWSNFNKKLKGLLQGIYREGADSEEKKEAAGAMHNAVKNQYLLTSDAIEFKLNQLAQNGGGTSFKEMLEFLKSDVSITLLGQANTAELPAGGGSRAALQVLNLIRSDIMFDDMLRTEQCINEQVLLYDAKLNLDFNITEPPYKFEFNLPDGLDPEVRARIITDLYDAGIPLLKKEVYDEVGLTAPEEGADILQKQSTMA